MFFKLKDDINSFPISVSFIRICSTLIDYVEVLF